MVPNFWFSGSGERPQKSHNGFYLPFCLGVSCAPALALMPETSVPPHMLLVPFKLLPRWSWGLEGVCLCKFGTGPLRGTARESSSFFH